jgi:hypothetical protein
MELNLPITDSDNKTILLFSGGRSSAYIAEKLKEKNGSLKNVIALYLPVTNIFRHRYAKNEHIRANIETLMQEEYAAFAAATKMFSFGQVVELATYNDCTFANGDNLIGDSGRLPFYGSLIRLLQEKGVPLTDAASAVIGFNKRIFEHQDLLNNVSHNFGQHIRDNKSKYTAILEKDPELTNYGNDNFVLGTYPPFTLFDVDELLQNDKLYFPFKDMTKSEIQTLVGK